MSKRKEGWVHSSTQSNTEETTGQEGGGKRNFYLRKVLQWEWEEVECVAKALVVVQPPDFGRPLVLHTLLLVVVETKQILD